MAKKPISKTIKKNALWEKLAKELRGNIPKLDTEGLAFLVEQSRIHLYNMKVEELNSLKLKAASQKSSAVGGKKALDKTNKTNKAKAQQKTNEVLRIDSTGSGFYLRAGGTGTMFSKSEMVQLIKIAHGSVNSAEAGVRLYAWFVRERSDVLSSIQVKDKLDKKLGVLAGYIKKNFKLK